MGISNLGLTKTSLIDYPGRVCAVLFTTGCNFRCPYCHNPELISPHPPKSFLPVDQVMEFLKQRRKILGGVSITGGEPLIHPDLPQLIERIHELGLAVKVDTNGSFPERLRSAAPDFVAVDLKTSLERYARVAGPADSGDGSGAPSDVAENVASTVRWVVESRVPHEIRTTMVPGIVTGEDIAAMKDLLRGTERYVLAGFRPGVTLDPAYAERLPYPLTVLESLRDELCASGVPCVVRPNSPVVSDPERSVTP